MKLITRRILFCFCFILFLISSPLIILYAFGYRYDFTRKILTQTGIIYLTPNIQNNIKILINDKEELDNISIKGIFKKEFALFNLVPKTYNIKVEKDNYHRWEKNLVVLPGLSTYAQPLLLPSNPKTSLIFSEIDIFFQSISDKFKKVFFLKNTDKKLSINIYDFLNKTLINAPVEITSDQLEKKEIIPENSNISLAPDGKKFSLILPLESYRIILLNSTEKNISIIADFNSKDKIIDKKWDGASRYLLYLNERGELNSYDTISKKSNKILENVLGFSIKNNDIYYLNRNNMFFYRTSINDPLKKQQLSYTPISAIDENEKSEKIAQINTIKNTKIIISNKNTFAAITPEKDFFLIRQDGIPASLGNNIEEAVFSEDGENLVFNSSFEIFTYDMANSRENLITRLSQKISFVNWYSDYSHIWLFTNQTIKNIELDSRPTPNIIDFFNIPDMPTNIIYTDSNSIYYDQLIDNTLSLYQVQIQN